MQQRAAVVGFEIDGEAALVAVEGAEEAGGETDQAAGRVAGRGFDLDHVGAEIGENEPRGRAHDGVSEFEHANAGQRQGGVGGCVSIAHAVLILPLPAARGEHRRPSDAVLK